MIDFSHLFADKIALVSRHVERGRQATDEMLLEAVQQFDDEVLQPADPAIVEDVLMRKRGRPPKAKDIRPSVAQRIEAIRHPALPRPLQDALARRLRSSHGLTERQRALRADKAMPKPHRNQYIRFLYRQIYPLLGDALTVNHPIFGKIAVPEKVQKSSKRDRAAEIIAGVLLQLGFHPPAKGRIFNIVSEK
jgi:hypothetical protein